MYILRVISEKIVYLIWAWFNHIQLYVCKLDVSWTYLFQDHHVNRAQWLIVNTLPYSASHPGG